MRKFLFLLLVFNAAELQAQKQVHYMLSERTAWAFGIRTGVNRSRVIQDPVPPIKTDSKSALYLGFTFNKPIGHGFSLRPEFYYSPEGYRTREFSYNAEINLDYINVPVLLEYTTPSGLALHTGPQVGLYMGGNDYSYNNYYSSGRTDFKWVAGAAFTTRFGLGMEVRYNTGLKSTNYYIYDYSTSPPTTTSYKRKGQVMEFGLIYNFSIAKKRPVRN